jgi:hypothetical protein
MPRLQPDVFDRAIATGLNPFGNGQCNGMGHRQKLADNNDMFALSIREPDAELRKAGFGRELSRTGIKSVAHSR